MPELQACSCKAHQRESWYPAQLCWERAQCVNDSISLRSLGNGVFTESKGHHGDDHHLAGVGLGAGHPNLTAGIDVYTTVGVAGNGAANCVGDANAERPTLLRVVQSLHRHSLRPLACASCLSQDMLCLLIC